MTIEFLPWSLFIVSLAINLFIVGKAQKIEKLEAIISMLKGELIDEIRSIEKKVLSSEVIDDMVDLKIYRHLEKCRETKQKEE